MSQIEIIKAKKDPTSFIFSKIQISLLGNSSPKIISSPNNKIRQGRKMSIYKPNWNFTNLITSDYCVFSIINEKSNKNQDKKDNNEQIIIEKNNLVNDKKKLEFDISQIYQIELKGNYKDENIDNEKIKLEIKCEKKNPNIDDFIKEDLFDKDNYYIFINNNKGNYLFEYNNYPSYDEMKLKYNNFVSSINENERNPYIIPKKNYLEIMKKIWDVENKEDSNNINIEYISQLNNNKSILTNIEVIQNKVNEKNSNNDSMINLNQGIGNNQLINIESDNKNHKIDWSNLYIENTNFEILRNNIRNLNIIELNNEEKIQKINENESLNNNNVNTNDKITQIKLDLMNSLNNNNEIKPPLTSKTEKKKDFEICNNKFNRSLTKPLKENLNDGKEINKNENNQKQKIIDLNMSYNNQK